jgi:hypothetical protein
MQSSSATAARHSNFGFAPIRGFVMTPLLAAYFLMATSLTKTFCCAFGKDKLKPRKMAFGNLYLY